MPRLSFRALFVCVIAVLSSSAQEPESTKPPDSPAAPAQPTRQESIIVTGSYEPIPLEEADRSVSLLDVKRLELLSRSFSDILRLDSSLDLRSRAPDGVQGDLSIRGATFGQTLVLLDGLRLNDVQSGHHNLDIPVPLGAVEQIEVLKGSGSTLYGSDAVGGVVNFVTRRPETSEVRLRGALGNWGVNQEAGVASYVRRGFTEQLSFSRDFSTGFIPNRDYRNLSLSSKTILDTNLGASEVTLAYNDRPFGAQGFYGDYPSWERTKGWFAGARQAVGQNTEVDFAYRRHTDLFVLFRDRPQVYTNRHAVDSYQVSLRRKQPVRQNMTVYYGAEGIHDGIGSNNLGNHNRTRGAGYAALDVRALHRFSFNAGVRDEVWGSFNHEVSPSVSGGVWLGGGLRLRASASRAFRLPTYTDLYYHDPANLGSPNLRPETAWSYEGGLEWNRGGRWRAAATVFERREHDGIDYVRASPSDIWRAMNFQRLNFTGVEALLGFRAGSSQRIEVQYTGLHGAQDQLDGQYSKYSFNYPVHSGLVNWEALWPGGISTRVRVGALERYERDPYALVDVFAARARGNVRPFLHLTNLSGTSYQEIPGVPMPGRGIVGGVDVVVFRSR